jgi:hypothetical protein
MERKRARGNGRAGGKEVGQRKLRGYRKERSKEARENEGGAKENIEARELVGASRRMGKRASRRKECNKNMQNLPD